MPLHPISTFMPVARGRNGNNRFKNLVERCMPYHILEIHKMSFASITSITLNLWLSDAKVNQ
jgi:hypothetical protein